MKIKTINFNISLTFNGFQTLTHRLLICRYSGSYKEDKGSIFPPDLTEKASQLRELSESCLHRDRKGQKKNWSWILYPNLGLCGLSHAKSQVVWQEYLHTFLRSNVDLRSPCEVESSRDWWSDFQMRSLSGGSSNGSSEMKLQSLGS